MNITKSLATIAVAGVLSVGTALPAAAAPNQNNQSGGAAGLVAAVVNANIQQVRIVTVDTGDVNVALTNIHNNNNILRNILNNATSPTSST